MKLTRDEQAMLDGSAGRAKQRAMDLLVRYAEALGAERFVDTTNVAGVPGSSTLFLQNYYRQKGDASYEAVFSQFDLDSDEIVDVPQVEVHACHLQGGLDPVSWPEQGFTQAAFEHQMEDEAAANSHGIRMLKTCTPYLAGNVPAFGEHCAWMESSAVVYCNSVLGARTNTEGRESTAAAMLTGKIPDWGFHRDEFRRATHRIEVEVPVESVMDWGMLGYFVGEMVGESIPVITGHLSQPDLVRHKHFGAAAASSGGVEMYHVPGVTPEAATLEMATGSHQPLVTIKYGPAERRRIYESLNANGASADVDYVMLGCPHASLEQIQEAARLLDGRKIATGRSLWIFTSRAIKTTADLSGLTKTIQNAGGTIMTDTCSAIGRFVPKGTRVVALDSAKQVHYLPAMMNVEAWFGSTEDCIRAAITGRWEGVCP
jgi:predicted aconitase